MKDEKWYSVLWNFIHENLFISAIFLLFFIIFALVFSLYNIETEAVLYASLLCLSASIIIGTIRFIFYYRKHKMKQKLIKNITLFYNKLPEPETLAEQDYQKMLCNLGEIHNETLTAWQTQRQNSMDYYSAWIHQIKTPISVMNMLLQSEDTEENRILSSELFRIEQYTEMALTYLRLDSNSTDFVFHEYNLDDIIRQAVHKYAPQFIRRKIKLVYKPVQISVLTDEKWLLFIIEQLLSNAIKYTKHGSVTITVTSEKLLRIADTGIGIAPEDLPRIFEKGFTGYNGRTDKKSTGLGLYLCKQTAEKLSLQISVSSEPGVGSVFTINLYKPTLKPE